MEVYHYKRRLFLWGKKRLFSIAKETNRFQNFADISLKLNFSPYIKLTYLTKTVSTTLSDKQYSKCMWNIQSILIKMNEFYLLFLKCISGRIGPREFSM